MHTTNTPDRRTIVYPAACTKNRVRAHSQGVQLSRGHGRTHSTGERVERERGRRVTNTTGFRVRVRARSGRVGVEVGAGGGGGGERYELIEFGLTATELGAQAPREHQEVVKVTCDCGAGGRGEDGAGEACGRRGGGSTVRALRELVHIGVENEAHAIVLARRTEPALHGRGKCTGATA
jgi:hypothetical protein